METPSLRLTLTVCVSTFVVAIVFLFGLIEMNPLVMTDAPAEGVKAVDTRRDRWSVASCRAHFDKLVKQHHIRHPDAVFDHLNKGTSEYKLQDLQKSGCEAVALWSEGSLFVQPLLPPLINERRNRSEYWFTAPTKLNDLKARLSWLPREIEFIAAVHTGDEGGFGCASTFDSESNARTTKIPALMNDVFLPRSIAGAQLVLPFTKSDWRPALERSGRFAEDGDHLDAQLKAPLKCWWRGKEAGHRRWQAFHHPGRERCQPGDTDRVCLVEIGPKGDLLDTDFGMDPNLIHRDHTQRPTCILAVDGAGSSGIFSDALIQGSLVLRIGGYRHEDVKNSMDWAWYEPLLVSGRHYVQSTFDELDERLIDLSQRNISELGAVAHAGRIAAKDLFTETTLRCHDALMTSRFAATQHAVVTEAKLDETEAFKDFDRICLVAHPCHVT